VHLWSTEALLLPCPEPVEGGASRACALQTVFGKGYIHGNQDFFESETQVSSQEVIFLFVIPRDLRVINIDRFQNLVCRGDRPVTPTL
jgi:hypothetical protein